ncbi:integrin beta-1-binding protein 2 isoform X2 [Apteryx mantelli]|uniref:Integrin beta-1-binding protein 2 isoform X2 n=1 Tax=Apteryx mantelli TaxID=2696672 RepID=A0ABM4F5M2_9AVES
MALPCSNAGCGQRFDPQRNSPDSCVYHPGVPIFHDALKGWSCCRKRTTDFSEFLAIKGCTTGYHSREKPPEPVSQEETSDKPKAKLAVELIIQGPASAEKMQRERPSSDEPRQLLPIKASRSLEQALEKLNLSAKEEAPEGDGAGEAAALVRAGTACKNAACKAIYQGPDSNAGTCTFHPGVPVFHEGMKYWSCCAVRTTDFGAFLEQPGCSTGRHCWADKGLQSPTLPSRPGFLPAHSALLLAGAWAQQNDAGTTKGWPRSEHVFVEPPLGQPRCPRPTRRSGRTCPPSPVPSPPAQASPRRRG